MSQHAAALRPAWTLLHLAVLGWGLALLVMARQPAWADGAGRGLWARVQAGTRRRGGPFLIGAMWAAMPCGLLYSALLVAALAGGPWQGAAAMALFALGSALPLAAAPVLLARLRGAGGQGGSGGWSTRVAGALLVAAAAWSLWADTLHRLAMWCGVAG